MIVIVVTVITQGPRSFPEYRGPIGGLLIINWGFFQAVGVISFGKLFIGFYRMLLTIYSFRLPYVILVWPTHSKLTHTRS